LAPSFTLLGKLLSCALARFRVALQGVDDAPTDQPDSDNEQRLKECLSHLERE
jgi:hypothetical protein